MGRWFSVRELLLAGVVGLAVGFGAFLLTAQASQPLMFPECLPVVGAGFDPMTGMPHAATIECGQLTGLGGVVAVAQDYPVPPDLAARRAVPVPLGFVAGGAITLIGLGLHRLRDGENVRRG